MKFPRILLEAVVFTPLVQNRSLIASGAPSSGRALPLARRASEAAACFSAISGVSVTKQLRCRTLSTARICASVISFALKSFFLRPLRASASVRWVRSVMSFHHFRHDVEALDRFRGVGQHRVLAIAVGDGVLAQG